MSNERFVFRVWYDIENSEKIKELQKLNKSLLRKLKGVRQRRKADIRHYETVLRYADKSAKDSALRKPALIEENKRLREALEVILEALQCENVCIPALRVVAYTALKGKEDE